MTESTHSTGAGSGASLPEIAIVEREGEPRALDTDVGGRLGMARPTNIRTLIEANMAELLSFGHVARAECNVPMPRGGFKKGVEYYLNEEQSLLIAAISKAPNAPEVRAMLIRTFVAFRRGHLQGPASIDMKAVGGMMKGILAKQLGELLPMMVREQVAEQQHSVVRGVSAGQVLAMAGLGARKGLRGMAPWLSHRLRRYHAVEGVAVRMAFLGSSQAYVFDPLVARKWLDEGGRAEIEHKAAERRGQGKLTLVQGDRP